MTNSAASAGNGRFVVSGAIAGAVSTIVFTVVHDIFISDIWSMLVIMLIAGVICGVCLGWSYGLLVARPSRPSWLVYNLIYDGALILLGVLSILLYKPETTISAMVASDGLPVDLLGQSLPLAVVFTLLLAVGITRGYGRGWAPFAVVLLTSVLLVLLLGHNVFILGLIDIPLGSYVLVLEMFGLILILNAVYVAVFILLERSNLSRKTAVSIAQ